MSSPYYIISIKTPKPEYQEKEEKQQLSTLVMLSFQLSTFHLFSMSMTPTPTSDHSKVHYSTALFTPLLTRIVLVLLTVLNYPISNEVTSRYFHLINHDSHSIRTRQFNCPTINHITDHYTQSLLRQQQYQCQVQSPPA